MTFDFLRPNCSRKLRESPPHVNGYYEKFLLWPVDLPHPGDQWQKAGEKEQQVTQGRLQNGIDQGGHT
jgi:hypothetical protein